MLTSLFPRAHARYTSLPLLGGVLEGLCVWLQAEGYPDSALRRRLQAAPSLAGALLEHGVGSLGELTGSELRGFAPPPRWSGSPPLGALVRSLAQYLEELGELAPTPMTPTRCRVADYAQYLDRVRGLADATITMHAATITEFLLFLELDARPNRLRELRAADVEAFVAKVSERVGRARLVHTTTVLRTFLRFLAAAGDGPPDLADQVESPRIYRGEHFPRALAWDTVMLFLRSIDRTTSKGLRDYAMFLLMATYGLRASEVRALQLDDISWRARRIQAPRPKVGSPLMLPLTDEVGTALVNYLRRGRLPTAHRHLFLRVAAPIGPLGRGAIGDAFRTWARRAEISLPSRGGPHCLRHAMAVHLLRDGVALKTIGDLLGHRSTESTCVYLRLDLEDLRDVALPLPAAAVAKGGRP